MKPVMQYLFFVLALSFASAVAAGQAAADEPSSGDLHRRISETYLDGRWDDLEKELKAPAKALSALTPAQKADVATIRKALAECRPAWWKLSKVAKRKVPIAPAVFGKMLNLTYDPAGTGGLEMQVSGSTMALTVSWAADDMDNPAHAEHGFSKGDLCHLGIWGTLGMARVCSQMPVRSLANLSERDRLRLLRYEDFRGNVTGLYYGTPKARRWGEFLYLLAWMEKYAKMPTVGSRKAAGAMFVAEILGNPGKYPSVPLPKTLAAEGAEQKLAEHFRATIEKQGWTLDEDRALREAIKAFAIANDADVHRTGKVALANRLTVSLDPEADATLAGKRDAWLKAQFEKAEKP